MQTGWIKDNGKWYYLESSGRMAANKWISNTYYVGTDGSMAVNRWMFWKVWVMPLAST